MTDLEQFQKSMERELSRFMAPVGEKEKPRAMPSPPPAGTQVQLVVREGRLKPDILFVHDSSKISRLEATIEAERAAREAGWPIIGRVHKVSARR